MVIVSPYISQSDESDSDAQSNYMSISSSSEGNISSFEEDESEGSDVELSQTIPSTFRGFLGRASEVLFPTVASFFSARGENQEEGREEGENPQGRRGFSPFTNIGAALSDVFRPSTHTALFGQTLRAYTGSMMRRSDSQKTQLTTSGKGFNHFCWLFLVILPSSSLERILRENQRSVFLPSFEGDHGEVFASDSSPMIFKISSEDGSKFTHCGVLEFTAPEGIVYVPNWVEIIPISSIDILDAWNGVWRCV